MGNVGAKFVRHRVSFFETQRNMHFLPKVSRSKYEIMSRDFRPVVTEGQYAHHTMRLAKLNTLRPSKLHLYLVSIGSYKQKMHVGLHDLKWP